LITTDEQVRRLMKLSRENNLPLVTAAAKAGMGEKAARKYLRSGLLPSHMKKPRDWRTREDPFVDVWSEAEALIKEEPKLEALTVFRELQRCHPGEFQDGQLRTFQRRVRVWRGLYGPDVEVFFPQIHQPGIQGQSDFTSMNSLDVTLGGLFFPHLLYHFVLPYSNHEYVETCFSESFESLSTGLQNALWSIGRVPAGHHRTDNLSAATFKGEERREFTESYMALMRHYGMTPTKNQPGKSNENGDVEQAHYRIKERVDQALLLRGSRNFVDRGEYNDFLRKIFRERNLGRNKRLQEELAVMQPLPSHRLNDFREYTVPVSSWSTVQVARNTYSAPSRLMRYEVTARLHAERVELYFAGQRVAEMGRLRGRGKARIDYRHVIGSLVRKPGAFENYRYREEMFPSTVFRQAYDRLVNDDSRHASRRYLEILEWAALNSEAAMEGSLRQLLDAGEELDLDRLVEMSECPVAEPLDIHIPLPDMATYDELLQEVTV
jgi:transposase